MKAHLHYLSSAALVGIVLGLASLAHGEDTSDYLGKALDLVHQVENAKDGTLSDAHRVDLLSQAITLAQEAPNHRLKGHRVLAIQSIRSAISEIQQGDANHKAADFLRSADSDLSIAVSLAGEAQTAVASQTPPVSPAAVPTSAGPGQTPRASLMAAAKTGDLQKVKELVQANPNSVTVSDDDEFSPLVAAAWAGHKDVVAFLLANHADINGRDMLHMTALIHAVQEGHKDVVEFLLANKADPNLGDNSGLTPLFYAALMARDEIAELLLTHGADVNAKGNAGSLWAGDTALYIAACNGNAKVVRVLLAHGADTNALSREGLTPLQIAIKNHHDRPEGSDNDVAGLLKPQGQKLIAPAVTALPSEITPEMEQAFLTKYEAALKKQDPDALFLMVANDPNMEPKAKEALKGLFLLGLASTVSNPNHTYSFVPVPADQAQDTPTELAGKMYRSYLPTVAGLKITFGPPDKISSSQPLATGSSILPLCVQDHKLMLAGLTVIPGAVPPPAVDKAANFGIEPNLRKVDEKVPWEDRPAFASLNDFLSALKQPAVEVLASGESTYEYYAICRIAPNLCVWAGGDKVGQHNYTFYFKAIDSNKQELDGAKKWIRLVDLPTDNGQAPSVQGTVFYVPEHYVGPITIQADYGDDSGKRMTFSRSIDWK